MLGSAYEFPGTGKFVPTTAGQTVSLPAGAPNAIYYKTDAKTPEAGDNEDPQGAIVYESAPSEALQFYLGSTEEDYSGFEMPYQATIPAGGTTSLRMAFVQAFTLLEVHKLVNQVLASYAPPVTPLTLTITSPANGLTVTSPSLAVTGTATGQSSLTVDGQAVSVPATGAWSTTVTLSPGLNVIGAVARNAEGISTTQSVKVTYNPPPPPPTLAKLVGNASAGKGTVSFTVSCEGPAGTSCELESILTTVEKTKSGKPIAVSAKKHHAKAKIKTKTLTVGSSKIAISVGQTIKITLNLNATGKSLLAKFGKLPIHLEATLTTNGAKSTVANEDLTIKGSKPKSKGKSKSKGKKHKS